MRKYGLIGFPLEHSFSKSYFEKNLINFKLRMLIMKIMS